MIYNELLSRGTSDFPIEYYYVDTTHERYHFPAHWHTEFEMVHILEGTLNIKLNNNSYTLRKGDVLFVNPETVHGGVPENCLYECMVFKPDLLFSETFGCRFFFESIVNREYILKEYFPSDSGEAVFAAKEIFKAMSTRTPGYKFKVIGAFYNFFGIVTDEHMYSVPTKNNGNMDNKDIIKLKRILSYIQEHYSENITLEEISEIIGVSAKYLCSFFKKMTGKTPFVYLNEYRIEQATQKLISSETSVTEIGFSCGFNDLSYFVKTFKQHRGVSPGQFRKGSN